ncbi:unnamed protein product [Ilex paraguariensis]|uniref:RNase H type-1 domain-containing protein n=1 Tax=Ilex paraguariensis TaxID=185542 RepID=A0ABC8RRJ6_9AQUA
MMRIRDFLSKLDFHLAQIYRETNSVADSLAGQAASLRRSVDFSASLRLPCEVGLALFHALKGMPILHKKRLLVFDDKGQVRKGGVWCGEVLTGFRIKDLDVPT